MNPKAIAGMVKRNACKGLQIKDESWRTCPAYAKGKANRQKQPKRAERPVKETGRIVSADLCEPIQPATAGGIKYILVIIDHYTRWTNIRLLKDKSSRAVLKHFKDF